MNDQPAPTLSPTAARQRVAAAFDPALFARLGGQAVEQLATYLRDANESRGDALNWRDPAANVAAAKAMLADAPGGDERLAASDTPLDPATVAERVRTLMITMLARGNTLHDPRYIGHQVPSPLPIAALFDAVGAVTNQVMAIYEMGPWSTAAERAMVETLGERIGFEPGTFAGLITSGGSLANLTALLTARNVALPDAWEKGLAQGAIGAGDCTTQSSGVDSDRGRGRGRGPVIVGSAESHYSVARTAGILGLGAENFRRVGVDAQHRLDPNQLDETLGELRDRNQPIVAVVAAACSTRYGAFDPLNDIADVCARHGVWLHVDAAHGGAACLSDTHKRLVAGLHRADSVALDAHKMLFMPALCAYVFYRDKAHRYRAFQQDAPYLFDPAAPEMAEYDNGLMTVECTKRAASFCLWGTWSLFGPGLFADMVDVTFATGRRLYELLRDAPDFEPLHEPQCNIVVFRHTPAAWRDLPPAELGMRQWKLRRKLIESGEFYIVPGKTDDGHGALRAVVMNPLTEERHLVDLLETLRRHAREMDDERSAPRVGGEAN